MVHAFIAPCFLLTASLSISDLLEGSILSTFYHLNLVLGTEKFRVTLVPSEEAVGG